MASHQNYQEDLNHLDINKVLLRNEMTHQLVIIPFKYLRPGMSA